MIWYKQGVMGELKPVAQKCKGRIARLYESKGLDLYITSIQESDHMAGTYHEIGFAFDFLKSGVRKDEIEKKAGPGWQIIDEGDHYHAEYDPVE